MEWDAVPSEDDGHFFTSLNRLGDIELTLHYRVQTLSLPSPTCNISAPFLSPPSSPPLLPSPFSFSPLVSTRLAPFFPFTVRRYLKDQITMATISHIVIAHTRFWWLFLFWRVRRCTRTSLADRQVTCSGWWRNNVAICWIHVFAHSERHWKTPSVLGDDSWQAITCQLGPSAPTQGCTAQSHFTCSKHI